MFWKRINQGGWSSLIQQIQCMEQSFSFLKIELRAMRKIVILPSRNLSWLKRSRISTENDCMRWLCTETVAWTTVFKGSEERRAMSSCGEVKETSQRMLVLFQQKWEYWVKIWKAEKSRRGCRSSMYSDGTTEKKCSGVDMRQTWRASHLVIVFALHAGHCGRQWVVLVDTHSIRMFFQHFLCGRRIINLVRVCTMWMLCL